MTHNAAWSLFAQKLYIYPMNYQLKIFHKIDHFLSLLKDISCPIPMSNYEKTQTFTAKFLVIFIVTANPAF